MKLFQPSARATQWLLVIGFCALGYALYMRYLAIEQTPVGLACDGGLDTWLCVSRRVAIKLYMVGAFGIAALIVAAVNLLRPSLLLFAIALAISALGVVLYNAGLSGLAIALLVLSLARRAPEPE
ncbi:MAG TPA: hypothetical protein VFB45_12695 [Pseudolabrys sp.]|nr:hypothetical protein [Pseudolabrys sp.]